MVKGFQYIVWYGDINIYLVVVSDNGESVVEFYGPVNRYCAEVAECGKEMFGVLFVVVLYTKVVNGKCKVDLS